MIVSHPRVRSVGRLAALAAAYAFVLQLVLASSLLASISPISADALHDLCFSAASTSSDAAGGGNIKPAVHCPLCVTRAGAVLLPTAPPPLIQRVAIIVAAAPFTQHAAIALDVASGHRARAPPDARLG